MAYARSVALAERPSTGHRRKTSFPAFSEAPRASAGQPERKATADIINYFMIEYTNAALIVTQKVRDAGTQPRALKPDAHEEALRKATQAAALLTPDPRVVEAVEGLMRAAI